MRTSTALMVAVVMLPLWGACGGTDSGGNGGSGPGGSPVCHHVDDLSVVVTDAWGRPVVGAALLHSQMEACDDRGSPDCFRLPDGISWFAASAPGYRPAAVAVEQDSDGCVLSPISLAPGSEQLPAQPAFPEDDLVPMPAEILLPPSGSAEAPVLFMALSHEWFADSGSPPALNRTEFFLSGEELYASLADDLAVAAKTVTCATWWWQSDFELLRPPNHPLLSEQERWPNTAMAILLSLPAVSKRVLVGRFTGETATGMAYVNTDTLLRQRAYDPGDNFEVMIQGNPTPVPLHDPFVPIEHPMPYAHRLLGNNPDLDEWTFVGTETAQSPLVAVEAASWHQKVWTIDGRVAYVSGMNVKSSDWDTTQHAVFEPRRMKYISPAEDRKAVADRLAFPDLGPRKDAGVRLEGPAAHAVDSILGARWEWGRGGDALFHEYATAYPTAAVADEPPDGVPAQIVATTPEPFGERSILEAHRKAIRNAESLIYIEDQYWRIPMLLPDFAQSLQAHPGLRIIVVTKPVSLADGALRWTIEMDRELKELAGDRYLLLQARVADMDGTADGESGPVLQPMDVHTKLVIVDDRFLTVGSANKNNRGMLYEGEMNAVILDPQFVAQVRARLFSNISGDDQFPWATAAGGEVLERMRQLALNNEEARLALEAASPAPGSPVGFLYPLELPSQYLLDCGPDAF